MENIRKTNARFKVDLEDIFEELNCNSLIETRQNIDQLRKSKKLLPDSNDFVFNSFYKFFEYD